MSGPCVNGNDLVVITVPPPSSSVSSVSTSNQVFCDNRTTFSLTGNSPIYAGEVVQWTTVSSPSGSTVTFGTPTSPTTSVTVSTVGSYSFRYTIRNSTTNCATSATASVSYQSPASISVTGSKLRNLPCNVTTESIAYTFSGGSSTSYQIISGPTSNDQKGIRSATSSPQIITGLDTAGTYVVRFYRNIANGVGCTQAFDDVTIIASRSAAVAVVGNSQFLKCGVTSTGLAANTINSVSGVGNWTQVSGPNTATIANNLTPGTQVTNLIGGEYVFRWSVNNGLNCPPSVGDLKVTISENPVANAGNDQTVCFGIPVQLAANKPRGGETGTWTVVSQSPAGTAPTFSNVNSNVAQLSNLLANTTYTLRWTVEGTSNLGGPDRCPPAFDEVIITTTNSQGLLANAGADRCVAAGTTNLTLSATNPSPATGTWAVKSKPSAAPDPTFGNATLFNSALSGLQNGTYELYWTVSDGVCTHRDSVTISIGAVIPAANAGPDQSICGTSTSLAATAVAIGTGTWTQVSGPGGASFANATNPATVVNGLVPGVYVFRWTVTNGTCPGTNTDDVTLTVSNAPSAAVIPAATQTVCGTNTNGNALSTTLTANAITSGVGTWTLVGAAPSVPTFDNVNAPTVQIGNLRTGNYKFRWTVTGGPACSQNIDEIDVLVQEAAFAGADRSVCAPTVVNLSGNGNSGTWSNVSNTSGTVPVLTASGLSGANASHPTAGSVLPAGNYTFRYTIAVNSSATCPSTPLTDDVVIAVAPQGTSPNAGPDQNLCDATSFSLSANAPSVGTGAWSALIVPSGGGGSFANTSNANTTYTPSGNRYGTYLLEWTITSGTCVQREQIRINNFQPPTAASAGADMPDACPGSVRLSGNVATVGIGKWTQTSGPTVTIESPAQPNSVVSGLTAPNSYTFRWTITNGPTCPASIDDVTITVPVPNPTPAVAGIDQNLCNATAAVLSATPATIGTGTWTLVSGPFAVISPQPPTSANSTVLSMTPGIFKFEWKTQNGACVSRDTVTITNDALPSPASAGVDIIQCNFDVLTLNATAPTSGTGRWTIVSKPSGANDPIFVAATSPTTQVNGVQLGTYVFRWTVSTGSNCTPTTDDVTVNIVSQATVANAGPNQARCANETITLAGNVPTVGIGTWSRISGPGIVTFNNPNLNNTTVTFSAVGTYVLRWSIGTGTCSSFDDVEITVRPTPTILGTQATCLGGVGTGRIQIDASVATGNALQYSLNSGAFQSNNIYPNLANGPYSIVVRDALTSCSVTTSATVSCADNPVIGLAKSAGAPVKVSTGVYDIPYTIIVRNLGNVALNNVQVSDNLAATFPSPATFTIQTPVAAASPLTPNGAFNGTSNTSLLNAASSNLAIGQQQTITFTVRLSLNGSTLTTFNNSARASGRGPGGTTTAPFDDSNNGGASAIDPNANGNPSELGENDPTPVSIQNPVLGVAKSAGAPVRISEGVFEVPYTILVKNLGNVELSGVQVVENLQPVFPAPVTYQIQAATLTATAPLSVNNSFNGFTDVNLLKNPSSLPVGATRSITFTVRITLNGSTQTTFNNIATGSAMGAPNDDSNNGGEAAIDPNANGNPSDTGENIPTPVSLSNAAIGVAKSVLGTPTLKADGSYDVTYQVIVRNFGNVALNNVQVVDNLSNTFPSPAVATVVAPGVTGASDANGTNFIGTNNSNANLLTGTGSLAVNESKTLQFTVNVKLNGSRGTNGTFFNSAEGRGTPANGDPVISDVSNNGTDPNPTGSVPTPLSLDTRANLSLQKSVNVTTPNVNDLVTYTIVVSNAGPNTATNVEVKDVLPAGLAFVSSSNLSNFNGTLTGSVASIAINGTATFSFVARVTQPGLINNKAEVSKADQGDPNSQPNSGTNDGQDDTDDAPLNAQQADLSLTKTVSKANPNVGETITFSITVFNAGPSAATNVQVRDVLPAGLAFGASTNFTNQSGTLLSNNILQIPANGSVTLNFTAIVTQPGTITNRAEVAKADQFDPDSQPNTGTTDGQDDTGAVTLNGQQSDLSLQKSVSDLTPNVGDQITYTIVVSNAGPSTATNVEIRDILPAGLSFVASPPFVNTNGTLTASITSIAAGSSSTLTFRAVVTPTAATTNGGVVVNRAEVSKADQFDPDSQPDSGTADGQDDTDDATFTVQRADLSLAKAVSNSSPSVGANVTFTITLTNAGPNTATNVQIRDVLPAGLSFVSSSDFTNASGTLTATVASLASGQSRTLTFVAKVEAAGTIVNRAEVFRADQFDPDSTPGNGTNVNEDDTGAVMLNGQQADLRLVKTVSKANPNVGEDITFTITVFNDGPNAATNVEVKDNIPVGTGFVSSSNMTFSPSNVVTGTAATIPPNGSVSFSFVAKVIVINNFIPAVIINKAEVTKSDQFDPDSQPNTGTDDGQDDTNEVRVTPQQIDLSLTKTVSKSNPNVGETITYSITLANAGPNTATNVQVRDVLPAGLRFVSSSNFTNTNGTLLSNNIASITAGGNITLTFLAEVTQAGDILNKAEVSKADQFDPDSRPDSGTDDGQDDTGGVLIGGQQADLSLQKVVSNATPNVGDLVTYAITVSNAGPSIATNVVVRDVLPAGLSFESSSDFANSLGTLSATINSLAVGSATTLTFVAKVTGNGLINNKAEIFKADQFDPDSQPATGTDDGQDDTDDAPIRTRVADLSLLKTVSNTQPSVGNTVTFSVAVSNAGPDVATNIEVKDVLPAGLVFVSSTDFSHASGTLRGTIASLGVGVTKTLTFQANVTQQGPIINKAEVSKADQFDPDSQPNTGTDDGQDDTGGVALNAQQADLSLTKTVSKTNPNVGETITYSITVANAGPNVATNVEVKDVLPAGLTFVSSANLTNVANTLTGTVVSILTNVLPAAS